MSKTLFEATIIRSLSIRTEKERVFIDMNVGVIEDGQIVNELKLISVIDETDYPEQDEMLNNIRNLTTLVVYTNTVKITDLGDGIEIDSLINYPTPAFLRGTNWQLIN